MKSSIIDRIRRLEMRRGSHDHADIPSVDTSVLSVEQLAWLREVADMVMKIRNGELEWTDDRVALTQDAMQLLDSCPKCIRTS
jgi:hypothetical protein